MNTSVEKIFVKYSEMDHNFALKPYSLLNFLQDIASSNAEELGFGYSYISVNNYAWFLLKYRMEFIDYPINIQHLTLKTRPRGYNKLFAYREFELLENDRLLGKIFSAWTIVDVNSRSTVPIGVAILDNPNMQPYIKEDNDLNFSKIKPADKIFATKEFEVRYNDIDVNGHANNGNYIIWALEPLTSEFKTNHKLKTLDMMFKKETKLGEKIFSEVSFKNDLTSVHRIYNEHNEDLCLLECVWV